MTTPSSAIVLGAGMVGVSTALHLRRRGHGVLLVDRRMPGQETSFGNAGLIQREAVEPYAMPRDMGGLWRIATGLGNDVAFSWLRLHSHLPALFRYWRHSHPTTHGRATAAYATLVARSLEAHEELIEATGSWHLVHRAGYRVLHRRQAGLEAAVRKAELLSVHGIAFAVESAADLAQAEPALVSHGTGAIHWRDPWSVCDPGALVGAYARLLAQVGGRIAIGDADTVSRAGASWRIWTAEGSFDAEHLVVCLGPWSGGLLARFGFSFPMVRKRGYHRHYRAAQTPQAPILDAERGYVMAPMTAGLRITTGAHLAALEDAPDLRQLRRAEAAARELMDLGDPVEEHPWHGTRPCMPDMLPVIGAVRPLPGLWLNFGHGHQGFTLGPASGAMLAAMLSGERPVVAPEPFRTDR